MKSPTKLIVIDDEKGIRELLSYELGSRGYEVACAENGEEGLRKLREDDFELVISDINMPKLGGLQALEAIKKIKPDVEVILVTGYGTIETAVTAMKYGAYDFVQKPFNIDEIASLLEKALERKELKALVAVHQASKAVFKSIKLDIVLPTIVHTAAEVLRADTASVMLLEGDQLKVAATHGGRLEEWKEASFNVGECVAGKVLERMEPIIIAGTLENDPRFQGARSLRRIKASIIHPLVIDGEVLGVLNVNRTKNEEPFNSADLRLMTIFCSQISQAIYNAKTYQRLKETQDQLIQSEKMNAIGMLAAGVAHELNNPLTSILGFASVLHGQEDIPRPQLQEDLECIITQSQRCGLIIQDLLQFSRKREPKKELVSLNALLKSAIKFAKYDNAASKVEIVWDCREPSPMVMADPNQMRQVFINLITNASHAMATAQTKRLEIWVEGKDDTALIRLKDSGCGISAKHLNKIFEPFFTTKPDGKGTGLGLSICRDIVTRHGGNITVTSQEGSGATFEISLPLYDSVNDLSANEHGKDTNTASGRRAVHSRALPATA